MSKIPSSVQYGTPISAPLLRLPGAGPRYDVPGTRKPQFGSPVETVKPKTSESKSGKKPGIGDLVDLTA